MHYFHYIFYLVIVVVTFTACEKTPDVDDPNPPLLQSQITVEVYYNELPQFPENDERLAGVTVWLYDEAEYQVLQLNHIRTGVTDSLGSVFLGSHNPGTYYISTSHPAYGIQEETVNAISSTHSFVSIRYPF